MFSKKYTRTQLQTSLLKPKLGLKAVEQFQKKISSCCCLFLSLVNHSILFLFAFYTASNLNCASSLLAEKHYAMQTWQLQGHTSCNRDMNGFMSSFGLPSDLNILGFLCCRLETFRIISFSWQKNSVLLFPFSIFIASLRAFVFLCVTSGLTRWRPSAISFPQQVYVCVCARTHIYLDTIWSPASTEPQRQPLCIDANQLKTNLLQVTTGGCMCACVCMCVQKKDNIKEDIVCAVVGGVWGKGEEVTAFLSSPGNYVLPPFYWSVFPITAGTWEMSAWEFLPNFLSVSQCDCVCVCEREWERERVF